MNFVPLLLVHLCNTAQAMLMIARCGVTAERQHVDCWSVSSPAALPASSKSVSRMNFVPLLLVHLCNLLAMLMIARSGVTAETSC
jgi:hypothetical protein